MPLVEIARSRYVALMIVSGTDRLTYKVHLPGGQGRLKEAALYVMQRYAAADAFGLVKLNKTLWKADFDAFAERGHPVTGRQYQRLQQGPVPFEIVPVVNEMIRDRLVELHISKVFDYDERRPVALAEPNLKNFSPADIAYLDRSVKFYWDKTGREASDLSHGVAWKTRENGDPMPYDLAYLSDEPLPSWHRDRLLALGAKHGWRSE